MFEDHLQVDGRRTWYRVVGDRTGAPPLLMLHGGPGGATPDDMVAVEHVARDRQVIAYDQLDTGRSDRVGDASRWTIEGHIAELEAVRRHLGLEEVHLWGQSWGGMLAISYVLSKPTGVRSLTMASAPHSCQKWLETTSTLRAALPPNTQRALGRCERTLVHRHPRSVRPHAGPTSAELRKKARQLQAQLRTARRPLAQRIAIAATFVPFMRHVAYPVVGLPFVHRHVFRGEELPVGLLVQQAGMNPSVYETMWGPSEFFATGPLKDFDVTDRLREVDVPVLVTSGRHEAAGPDVMQLMVDLLPDAEWQLFDDSAHCAEFEEPDRYAAILRDFLQRVDAA